MKKEIPSNVIKLKGFTLVPDKLVEKYSLITACVYGVVRRYCKMRRGVCQASTDTLAEAIGVSRKTLYNHLLILCEDGYVEDRTPELRNRPHTYADTGLLDMESSISIESDLLGVTGTWEPEQSPKDMWEG